MRPLRRRLLLPEIVRAGEWRQSKKQGHHWENRSECRGMQRGAAPICAACAGLFGDRRIAWNSHTSTSSIGSTVTGLLRLQQLFCLHSDDRSAWIGPPLSLETPFPCFTGPHRRSISFDPRIPSAPSPNLGSCARAAPRDRSESGQSKIHKTAPFHLWNYREFS
jgi:hypothetical protein